MINEGPIICHAFYQRQNNGITKKISNAEQKDTAMFTYFTNTKTGHLDFKLKNK